MFLSFYNMEHFYQIQEDILVLTISIQKRVEQLEGIDVELCASCAPETTFPTITNKKGYSFIITHECSVRKNVKIVNPQKNESSRPIGQYQDDPMGYIRKDELYQCQLCNYKHKKHNSIQQHCLAHFPAKYNCLQCGDAFHIKTQINNHYLVKCIHCNKKIKKGSISSHNCRKLS